MHGSIKRAMTLSILFFVALSANFAASPQHQPLEPSEKREIAGFLAELKVSRERVRTLEEYIDQLKLLEAREDAVSAKELEAERRLRAIAERERDAEKTRGDQLELALKVRNRKPGFGCKLKRAFTLGLARCG